MFKPLPTKASILDNFNIQDEDVPGNYKLFYTDEQGDGQGI